MSSFNLSFSGGSEFVQQLSKLTQGIQETLDQMDRSIQPNLAEWLGSTKGAYENHKAEWNKTCVDMAQGLGMTSQTMGRILDIHGGNEADLTKRWNN